MNHVIFTMLKISLILRCIILDYVNEYLLTGMHDYCLSHDELSYLSY
jgi:hypothetical protein